MQDHIPTLAQLGEALRGYLATRAIGLREAEAEFGISRSTLSRASRGLTLSAQHFIVIAKKVWPPAN